MYSLTDMPQRAKAMLSRIGVTPDFSKEMVYVTCSERADEQKTCLDGMKIKGNTTGFLASYFPYSNEKKHWPKMVIDLSKTSGIVHHSSSKNSNPSSTCPGKTTVTLHWSVELGPRISSTRLKMFYHTGEFLREEGALNSPLKKER